MYQALKATVGAGETLKELIVESMRKVYEANDKLVMDFYRCHESGAQGREPLPGEIHDVVEALNALKNTPPTNISAIAQTVKQEANSIQDSLREIDELKASLDSAQADKAKASTEAESSKKEASGNEVGSPTKMKEASADEAARSSKVSPEEMKIAGYITDVTSGALDLMNELLRFIMGFRTKEMQGKLGEAVVQDLEKICKGSKSLGPQIKELGSCIALPQNIKTIKRVLRRIKRHLNDTTTVVLQVGGAAKEFTDTWKNLKDLMERITTELHL